MIKKLLGLIAFFISIHISAQTLYWVGGSGYWNDVNHWSTVSGGNTSNTLPNATTHVVFDNNSSAESFTIHATQSIDINSLDAYNNTSIAELIGATNLTFKLNSHVQLNPNFKFHFNGKIQLTPNQDENYNFSHTNFTNEIVLTSNHTVELGVLKSNSSIKINGNCAIKNSIVNVSDATFLNGQIIFNNTTFQARNFFSVYNATFTTKENTINIIIAPRTQLSAEQLSNLSSIERLSFTNPIPQACNPTLVGFTNPTCPGLCNGTATISLAGCSNPSFDIQWLNAGASVPCQTLPPVEVGFAGGTYTVNTLCGCGTQYAVLVTNNIGEQGVVNLSIVDPPPTFLSFTKVLPSCNGLCDGQIRLNVITGAIPLNINWNPPTVTHSGIITKDTLKNACAGLYTITATNANGCNNTFTTTLTQPAVLSANGTAASVTCGGSCNGGATVTPTGGTIPYTYTWSAGVPTNTNIVGGLCPGIITATVVDSKTCTTTYTANITQPPASTVTLASTNLSCGGVCNGSATITAIGGTPAFTYSLNGVSSGSVITNLCVGNYTADAKDALGCTKTVTFSITSPPTLTATPTQTNITCFGLCNGVINLNPSGGTLGYSYAWSPVLPNSPNQTNLCAGVYSYTLTDALLCTKSGTVNITQPSATTLTVSKADITCFGLCNGSASVTVTGGTPAFNFTWTPAPPLGQGTGIISNLCIGSYSASITDFNGCPSSTVITITQPASVTPNISTVQPTCNGSCDGSIISTPTGGIGAFTFTLQSATATITTSPPYNGLCAGSYTLFIANNGCVTTNTINLLQPNPITLSLNATPLSCFGQCNSNISTVINGGTPTYTVNWSNGSTGLSLTNQCAGVYSATVTGVGGCTATAAVTVTAPTAISVTITPTQPLCFGNCNGIATATASGGTPNYTYVWAPSGGTNNIESNLCAGVYTVTVTDNLLCTKTGTVNIQAPPAITLTTSGGTVSCTGTCDGTVGVVATGGTPGFSYNWSSVPSQTTAAANNLCQGNYFINVTDGNGCTASNNASVTQPTPLTASITGIQSSCNVCIGAATITVSGGTPVYSYTWTNAANAIVSNTNTASNLCIGFYTVTVKDASGCATTQTLQINQTVIVVVTTNGNTLQCNGGCTGIANASPSGGTLPYSFTWTPTGPPIQATPTATGLCAGTYTVMVEDALGCSNTGTVTFANPPATTVTVSKTDELCFGQCNGTASVTAIGGAGGYTYQWLPGGQTTPSVSGLCGGIYSVEVTDANNCVQSQTFQIIPATSITATYNYTLPTTCISTDGVINATISGGAGGYTFTWTPGGAINPLINVGAGVYNLSVKDLAGCTQTLIATLNPPSGPTITATSTNSITCFGLCNGSATVTAIGVAALSYSWAAGTTPTSSITTGLCAGITAVSVTDGNNCTVSTTVNIAQPVVLTANGLVTDVTCNGACTGSVNLTPIGGTAPYTATWTPSGPTNLCIGNYTAITTDSHNCSVTNTFVVVQPLALALSFNKKDVLCNGGCTGGVKAIVSGGNSPYTYSWSNGAILDTIVNLCTGTYTVNVVDAMGCSISGTVNIGQPAVLTSTATSLDVTCNALCDGSATITANGGTLPYTYSWNTTPLPTSTQTVGTLCVGIYQGTITDANGCISSQTVNINQPTAITVTITPTNPTCNALCNGSFSATVSGGIPNYTYQWIPVAAPTGTLQNPTGLCAGNYTFIVTDNNGCAKQALSALTNPTPLLANATFTNPLCNGNCNGIATANPVGGTGAYTYSWTSPTQATQTINNLCAGSYTIVVTDANLCTDTQTITLAAPIAISLNPAVTPAACTFSNGTIDASGVTGVGPFTYNWLPPVPLASHTNTIVNGLAAGVYTVIITNSSACSATVTIPLSNSNGPSGATLTTTNVACHGQCNGAATVSNPVGGTPSYTLSWVNPLNPTSTVTGLCAGSYTAQIKDALGCILFRDTIITEPQIIDDNEVITPATCFGLCNGSIALNPTGGNGGYTYSWSPSGATTGTVNGLCPGSITATVTDNKGCTLVSNYNTPSLVTITSNTFATNNICFGDCNGTLLVNNFAGGLPPYNVLWNNGQTLSPAINLCDGNYSVTITDANGCLGTNSGSISSTPQISSNPTITQPSCNQCNGSAMLNPTGGNGGFTYVWSNTQIVNPATNLCSGVYGVQITDNQGCVTNTNIVVNSSSGITGEIISKADETCAAQCNGTVNITAVGGASPIIYHWVHNGSSLQTQTNLCAGTYFCNMTDANGCTRTASVVIGAATTLSVTTQVKNSACSVNTGSIGVVVTGGVGTYNYTWLPAVAGSTPNITGLAVGIYSLTITDGNGCAKSQTFVINNVNGPVITSTVVNSKCASVCSGSIDISISGGTPSYTTVWSNGGSTPNIGLCSGNYSVTVTDNLGCKAVQGYSISGGVPIVFSTPNLNNPKCHNDCNGSITAIASGGALPFTYSWSPSSSSSPTTNSLCAGVQTFTVTDMNGCSATDSYTLINPASLGLTASVLNPTCSATPSGSIGITPIGGTPVITFSCSNGSITNPFINLLVGNYTITLTDGGGCKKDTTITLTSTLVVNAVAGNDTVFCQNGTLLLNGTNSVGGITYDWLQLPGNTAIANTTTVLVTPSIGTSTYVLIATNGTCIDSDTINVKSNAPPIVDAGPFVNIPIYTTSQIGGAPTSSTGGTYTWTPNFGTLDNYNASNPTASNTVTMIYTVTVTDANGCSGSDTVTVFIYPEIKIPTGFSPNADGKNDVWQIDNIFQFPDNVVEVYNRWGELLFMSKGYAVPFDGKYNGKDLPVGTYYYIIDLHHPAFPKAYTGPLTIFR